MNALKLTFLNIITILILSIPTVAYGNGGYSGETSNCESYGGFTYCLRLQYSVDCDGWTRSWYGWYSPDGGPWIGGGPIPPSSPPSGPWTQPGFFEEFDFNLTLRLWISGPNYLDLVINETFYEPPACDYVPPPPAACTSNNQYYMYTFYDQNQPVSWQKYCYIVSGNGYPSVESQATFCSVPGFDYRYRATQLMYEGWVTKDCKGEISYGWPAWDPAWFRSNFVK